MIKINENRLPEVFKALSANSKLYIPVDTNAGSKYEIWDETKKLSLALNTNRSAKDFFFPQIENIADFKLQGKTIEVYQNELMNESFVVFGVRACDAASFKLLDSVFLNDPVDTFYKARREHGVIITAACSRPSETCFCTAFGIDPTEPDGDISSWTNDGFVYFEANTEKGEAVLEQISSHCETAKSDELEEQKQMVSSILDKLPLKDLDLTYFKSNGEKEIFASKKWDDLFKTCLGCGTCTFVCPTCQCYDIVDFDTGDKINRFRCWDSCMYSDFTKMAHGNPRLTQKERFRQRFMHKLVYYPTNNNGVFSCVGCGRCLSKCPQGLNIAKVIKAFGGDSK